MLARSPQEQHRQASFLELFYDLIFVVAIATAAELLHHGIVEGHLDRALGNFFLMFFAIWWAWMQFTWFASTYDNDDLGYRLAIVMQMIGALILASGIGSGGATLNYKVVSVGYVIIRVASVGLWIRVGRHNPSHRKTARRFILTIGLCQLGWLILPFLSLGIWGLLAIIACEIMAPIYARDEKTRSWHPRHIAERYGLMTIIVLGEATLSVVVAIKASLASFGLEILLLTISGFILVIGMWWLYFLFDPSHDLRQSSSHIFKWAYGHYIIFTAITAVGAGISASVDVLSERISLSHPLIAMSITMPTAVYLFGLWFCFRHLHTRLNTIIWGAAILLVLASAALPYSAIWVAFIVVGLLGFKIAVIDETQMRK